MTIAQASLRMALPPSAEGAAPAVLRLTLFGPMRAEDRHGNTVLARQRKTRALLAILAMAAPRPVLRAEITALLWSRRDPDQARQSLRQVVHELHESLAPADGGLLRAERTALALHGGPVWVDAMEVLRATAYQADALALLDAGPLLLDLEGLDPAFDAWIAAERQRIARFAAQVAEAALAACGAPGAATPSAVAAAERLVRLEPTAETGWRALMHAHAARDERSAALCAFERCAAALRIATGAAPSAETIALLAAIRGQTLSLQSSSFAESSQSAWPPGSSGAGAALPGPARTVAGLRRGVRLGVMPFRTMLPDAADGLAFGLAEEITTALARFRGIYLIASPTLAAVQAEATGARERLLGDLALDFLLDGTIQRAGGRVRVMVRLLDMRAPPGGAPDLVWTQRFDGTDADLLTLQDRLAAETVAQVDPQLLLHESRRVALRPPRDITAYDLLLHAIPAIHRLDEATFRGAGAQLARAVEADPDYAAAHAWFAYWTIFLVGQGWAPDPEAAMRQAGALAERAVQLDPSDARALTIAGHVRAFGQQRADEAMALHERALSHNPNLPIAWALSGLALAYDGHHSEAVRRAEEGRRLSPFDPHQFFFDACEMVPQLALGAFERVVELARRSIAHNAGLSATYKGYLSALGHLPTSRERAAEREAILRRLLALEPAFCVADALARSPLLREEDRALYAAGLRAAGLPEGAPATAPSAVARDVHRQPRDR